MNRCWKAIKSSAELPPIWSNRKDTSVRWLEKATHVGEGGCSSIQRNRIPTRDLFFPFFFLSFLRFIIYFIEDIKISRSVKDFALTKTREWKRGIEDIEEDRIWERGSRQFLKLCSRRCNGRRSEMPRKWQVQLGPNFIKHNPICALILPKRLAADAALLQTRGEKRRRKKACASFQKLSVELSFRVSFFSPSPSPPLSLLPVSLSTSNSLQRQRKCREIDYETDLDSFDPRIKSKPFFFFSFFYTRKKAQDGKIGRSVVERYERGAGCGRRAVSVKTQIVSWKEDAATWLILLARVPAPLDLQDLSISGSCLGPASSVVTVVRNSNWTHYRA